MRNHHQNQIGRRQTSGGSIIKEYDGFSIPIEIFIYLIQRMVETCPNYNIASFFADDCCTPVAFGGSRNGLPARRNKIRRFVIGKERNHLEKYGWVSCRSCLITKMGLGDVCTKKLQEKYESS